MAVLVTALSLFAAVNMDILDVDDFVASSPSPSPDASPSPSPYASPSPDASPSPSPEASPSPSPSPSPAASPSPDASPSPQAPAPSRDVLAATSLEDWVKVSNADGKDGACAGSSGRHAEAMAVIQTDLAGCVDACASDPKCAAVSFETDCEGDMCECLLDAHLEGESYTTADADKFPNYQCWVPLSTYEASKSEKA
jgi:hypothetical protein